MLKKVIIGTILTLASSMAIADHFSGFYAGIGTGRDTTDFSIDDKAGDTYGSEQVITHDDQSGKGFFGNIFAGYGRLYQQFYLGGEINAAVSSLEYHYSANYSFGSIIYQLNRTYDIDSHYGIAIRPGYVLIENVMLYGKLSYLRAHVKTKVVQTDAIGDFLSDANSRNISGIGYGFGLEAALSQQWNVRVEYEHVDYNDYTETTVIGAESDSITITPRSDQFGIALAYRFG